MEDQSHTSIDVSKQRVRDALAVLRDQDGSGEEPQWAADILRQAATEHPALLTNQKTALIDALFETPAPQVRVLLYNLAAVIARRHPQFISQLHGQMILDLQATEYPRHGFISQLIEIEALSSRHVPVHVLKTLLTATESHPNPGIRHRAFVAVTTAVEAAPHETAGIWDTLCTLATGDEQSTPPSLYRQTVRYVPDAVYAAVYLRHATREITHTESFSVALLEQLYEAAAIPEDANIDYIKTILLYHGFKSHVPQDRTPEPATLS
jgi:hypothetical protein